ncbi:MAG: ABC transporter permease [Candidatus Schekmanbacteria bacterium]|nr:ABC transporter permease [Candidatus Schekmanbacteria bacterium]
MTHTPSFFARLLLRSLLERKGRVTVALASVTLGASVIAAFVTLYVDVGAKMSRELRAYGANFVVEPGESRRSLTGEAEQALRSLLPAERLVGIQALLYDVVELQGRRLVAAGMAFDQIRAVTPYWQLSGNDGAGIPATGCLLGRDAARKLGVEPGHEVELVMEARRHRCAVTALVETGGAEDGQVFLPFGEASTLFARPGEIDLLLASIIGALEEAEGLARALEQRAPGVAAHPILKLSRSEGIILEKVRAIVYVAVVLITASTFVSLLIALLAMVSQRRREIALMKALGATDRRMRFHFLAEVAITGVAAGILGLAAGYGLANLIERVLFATAVSFRWWLVPLVPAVAVLISAAGALIPLRMVTRLHPALVLKGDY